MDVLFSIKSKHITNINNGSKKFEYRKTLLKKNIRHLILYETSPVMRINGYCNINSIYYSSLEEVWQKTKDYSGLDITEYQEYYKEKNIAIAYNLTNIVIFREKIDPNKYINNFHAPQSFYYIHEEVLNGIIRDMV